MSPSAPSALETTDRREAALLASYAMFSRDSRGRKHPEAEHPYRGPYQRDRDRILHSHAFRRLAGKMQVFTGDMGDYHRTRLTHTHEVASIARTRLTRNGVALDLIDTGTGMDEKTAMKMFEPFYSTKSGGSGLGLPTARKIIEAHGGRIGVHSEVGRGTQFTLEFPTPPRIGDDSVSDPDLFTD